MIGRLLCVLALAGGVRALPDPDPRRPEGDARAVIEVEVIAVDPTRHLVAAKQRLADGRVLLAVTDVARDVPYYTGLVTDDDDVARGLSDARMTPGSPVRIDAAQGKIRVPTSDGVVDVTIDVRPPTPAEFATDARILAWRDARIAADRPYASTEVLLVLFTVSHRIVASDVYEAAPGRAVDLTVPAAYVDRGTVVFVERATAAPGRDAWALSPLVDLAAALAHLDELPMDEPLTIVQGAPAPASTLPSPDEPTETREPDVAETICCGLPVFGGLCAGLWCLQTCDEAFKARR